MTAYYRIIFAMCMRYDINLRQVEDTLLTAIFKSALDNEQSLANSEQASIQFVNTQISKTFVEFSPNQI